MKIFKVALVIASLLTSQLAAAAPTKSSSSSSSGIALNPTTIQRQLLKNNNSVLISFNAVKQAKDEVNIARGNLLPSLNLGGLLSGGGFILSSINFLMPFLLPSNWANYYSQKNLFESEKLSYKLIQLNTYSSALSLYYTLLSDTQLQQIYQQQYMDLQQVYELQKRKSNAGVIPVSDLLQTQAQAQMAGVRSSQLLELNKQEVASLRKSLALSLNTGMNLEFVDAAASPYEFESMDSTIRKVNSVSVERTQVRFLLKAAKEQVWSKSFGWINSASVGSVSVGGANAGLDHLSASGSISLGFATYPTIQLSEHEAEAIELQDRELAQENTRIVESALGSLAEAKQQLDLATQAENQMARVYQIRLQEYDQGTETLTNVLLARTQMSDASVARVKAGMDVNMQRSLLHRALLSSNFSDIRGCSSSAKMPEEQKKQSWLGRKLNPITVKYPSLDDICR